MCFCCIGCEVPQKVTDDVQALRIEVKSMYEFNQQFLKRTKSTTKAELDKKLKLIMISKMAYQRAERGLVLLAEYLKSSEIVSTAQLAATEETIKKIANKVAEKMQEE